jgi:hypothetical protein
MPSSSDKLWYITSYDSKRAISKTVELAGSWNSELLGSLVLLFQVAQLVDDTLFGSLSGPFQV